MRVSVILCTCNPEPALLARALASLTRQTATQFEVVLVDNRSTPPLSPERLTAESSLPLRVVREERPGLTYARCCGIAASTGDLIVFVDDDNELDPEYLAQASAIAGREPAIGHFGGVARADLRGPIPSWKRRLLPFLGIKDAGADPITSSEPHWGAWEPIGAGMVTRRVVAEGFVAFVTRNEDAQALGRRGSGLMSGEDTLMARVANSLGFACSYQPALKLTHVMKPSRLRPSVLARTIEGHGRSHVVLERLLDRPVPRPSAWWMATQLPKRLLHRLRTHGFPAGVFAWCWDLGYVREARTS